MYKIPHPCDCLGVTSGNTWPGHKKNSLSDIIAFSSTGTHIVCVRACTPMCLNVTLLFAQTYYSVILLIFALRTADKTTCKYRGRRFECNSVPLRVHVHELILIHWFECLFFVYKVIHVISSIVYLEVNKLRPLPLVRKLDFHQLNCFSLMCEETLS